MSIEAASLKKKIKKNRYFKKLKENLDSDRYNVPFDLLRTEISQLHRDRKLHAAKPTDPNFGKKFIQAAQIEVSTRSRLTEMRTMLVSIQSDFRSGVDHLHDYLIIEHSSRLKIFGTIKERDRFMQAVLRNFYEYLREIETLLLEISYVIEDLDKSGYAMKSMVDLYSVIFKNEGRLVR